VAEHSKDVWIANVSTPALADEFCTNCGGWYSSVEFNYDTGWCVQCSLAVDPQPRCSVCGTVLVDVSRTTCHTCRQEHWYVVYADELEFVMLVKGYSLYQAKIHIARINRPICQCCRKPIKGAAPGALFCKQNKACHRMYGRYRRLIQQGLSQIEALDRVRDL
jgi:hypothetical protein